MLTKNVRRCANSEVRSIHRFDSCDGFLRHGYLESRHGFISEKLMETVPVHSHLEGTIAFC